LFVDASGKDKKNLASILCLSGISVREAISEEKISKKFQKKEVLKDNWDFSFHFLYFAFLKNPDRKGATHVDSRPCHR